MGVENLDPAKVTHKDLQLGISYTIQRLSDEITQICGITFLQDLAGFSLMNTIKLQPDNDDDDDDDEHFLFFFN